MIFTLFVDWKLMNMRIFALILHLITTCMLIWTKFDSIQISMVNINDDEEFIRANTSYMTFVGFAIPFLTFELGYFLFNNPANVTFASVLHFCLDFFAIFMNSWIVLDGLDWYTAYVPTWLWCVLFPALFDLACLALQASSQLWIRRHTMGMFEKLYMWWHGKKPELQE